MILMMLVFGANFNEQRWFLPVCLLTLLGVSLSFLDYRAYDFHIQLMNPMQDNHLHKKKY